MLTLSRGRWVVAGCLVSLLGSSCGLDRAPSPGGDSGSSGAAGEDEGGGRAGKSGAGKGGSGAGNGGGAGVAGSGGANAGSSGNGANAGTQGDAGEVGAGGSAGEAGFGGAAGDPAGEAGEGGRSQGGAAGEVSGGGAGSGGAGGSVSGAGGSAGATGGTGGSGGAGGEECVEITLANFAPHNLEWPSRAGERAGFFNLGAITLTGSVDIVYRLDEGGGRQKGLITLSDGIQDDFTTCTHCVTARDSTGRTYMATAGTLYLDDDSDQEHGYPQGEILNVTLREADIHPTTWETQILPNGICLFFTSQTLDIDPVGAWTQCPPEFREDQDCDCGCGELDPTCSSASASQCDYCWCEDDRGSCSASLVVSDDNAICSD